MVKSARAPGGLVRCIPAGQNAAALPEIRMRALILLAAPVTLALVLTGFLGIVAHAVLWLSLWGPRSLRGSV